MSIVRYEIASSFEATPLRHRTSKQVFGVFESSFDVRDVPTMTVAMVPNNTHSCEFYTDGVGLFEPHGCIDYVGKKLIPDNISGFNKVMELAVQSLDDDCRDVFPKNADYHFRWDRPQTLSRDLFNAADLRGVDEQFLVAEKFLSEAVICNGRLYARVREPMLSVNVDSYEGQPRSVSITLETWNTRWTNHTVAYFDVLSQADAENHAQRLAAQLTVPYHPFRGELNITFPEVFSDDPSVACLERAIRLVVKRSSQNIDLMTSGKSFSEGISSLPPKILQAFVNMIHFRGMHFRGGRLTTPESLEAAEVLLQECADADIACGVPNFLSKSAMLLREAWINRKVSVLPIQGMKP